MSTKKRPKPSGAAGLLIKQAGGALNRPPVEVRLPELDGLDANHPELTVQVREPSIKALNRVFQDTSLDQNGLSVAVMSAVVECSELDGEPFFGSMPEAREFSQFAPTSYVLLVEAVMEWSRRLTRAVDEAKNGWRPIGSSAGVTPSQSESASRSSKSAS